MAKYYFIAGASGSGKSAIIPDLRKILGNDYVVHDFDSIGVPTNADKKWRQETTEKWLRKLLQDNKDACLLGQMVLGEILACPSAKQIASINFCLLDVSDYERIKRLKGRNIDDANQNMLNWSSWLRMHHQDPQWEQHVLKEDCWHGLNFIEWDMLEKWDSKATVKIIDTTKLNVLNLAEEVGHWIKEEYKYVEHLLNNVHVRTTDRADVPFMVELSYKKRRSYEKTQPRFWRYAGQHAESVQTTWFESLLNDVNSILLTVKHEEKLVGFIIGKLTASPEVYNPGGLTLLVDDFCVDDEVNWQFAGKLLIDEIKKHAKAKGAVQMVVVCGNHDRSKAHFLAESDLAIVSNWYLCDLN